ncbi:MAG: ArsC/Spx/MgsR family protein [Bacteroidota bacterium]
MANKMYYLHTCSTCQRIIKELGWEGELQDIKTEKMTAAQLEEMKEKDGSNEALFRRRAMKYRSMGLGEKNLSEDDYRDLILEEYTFLKRPVMLIGDAVFVGNSKKNVEAARKALG